jgi:hypothetical protein
MPFAFTQFEREGFFHFLIIKVNYAEGFHLIAG